MGSVNEPKQRNGIPIGEAAMDCDYNFIKPPLVILEQAEY
jgi:hypothetical protein